MKVTSKNKVRFKGNKRNIFWREMSEIPRIILNKKMRSLYRHGDIQD